VKITWQCSTFTRGKSAISLHTISNTRNTDSSTTLSHPGFSCFGPIVRFRPICWARETNLKGKDTVSHEIGHGPVRPLFRNHSIWAPGSAHNHKTRRGRNCVHTMRSGTSTRLTSSEILYIYMKYTVHVSEIKAWDKTETSGIYSNSTTQLSHFSHSNNGRQSSREAIKTQVSAAVTKYPMFTYHSIL
jgi:hypothetical protein